jgi:hypothetical protein
LALHISHRTVDEKCSSLPYFSFLSTVAVQQQEEFLFWPVGSFALLFLITFKSEFLNGERVIISDGLADLPLLMAAFDFGRRKEESIWA